MRIIEINTVCGVGSTGRIVVDLANILTDNGYECEIAFGQFDSKYKNSYKIGSSLDSIIHKAGSRLFDRQAFFSQSATRAFIRHLKDVEPDIIHLHNLHGHYLNIDIFFRYLQDAQIPVIWTLHDCWPFTGHCAYFDYVECRKWKTGCEACPNIRSYPPAWFFDNSKNNFQKKREIFNRISQMTIVTPSQWLANMVHASFLSKYEVRVIHNGIDTAVFQPRKESAIRDNLQIGDHIMVLGVALGGFTGRKGLDYFLRLAEELPSNYRIVLIGVTDNEMKILPHNILGVRQTANIEELADFYSAADIFVNPTLEDNFPTTNLEALACGTPVLTFDTGGSPESLDQKSGSIVKKGNFGELLHSILDMADLFKKEHSANCRLRATSFYDKNIAFASYIDLFRKKFSSNKI